MFTTRPDIVGSFGVVSASHWIPAQAGMRMLEQGGTAFDAAAAAGFALQVIMPHMNGPGGDAPILFAGADGAVQVLCGQGTAPAAASIERFRALGLDMIPGTGLLPAVVPGAVDAWLTLLRDHGRLDIADILAPAAYYARTGWPLHADTVGFIAGVAELFRDPWPSSGAVYLQAGAVPPAGCWFANPSLADSFDRLIAAAGDGGGRERRIDRVRRAFYQGFVAEAIDRFCRTTPVMDSSGRAHRGLLTGADMAGWQAGYEPPVTLDYRGITMAKTGPWGQGPVMLQMLALLDGFDLAAMDPCGADFIHVWVEAAKLAFADRDAYYGDPRFAPVPLDHLLSPGYAAERRQLIGATASDLQRPGQVPGHCGLLPEVAAPRQAAVGIGEPTAFIVAAKPGDTCHIDAVDRWGNMVSATPSGGWLQSSPIVAELGFPLGTRAQMFWLEPGLPGSLAPGKRPRTTLSPSLALRDGQPWLAFGTPGGDKQDQWTLVTFLRHLHYGMGLQQALDAPLFDTDHVRNSFYPRAYLPRRVSLERRLGADVARELERRGHDVQLVEDWSLGWVCAAARDGTRLTAAASPRGMQTYAVGR